MRWTVYMLQCADGTLYTGIATDVTARIAKHSNGTGAKYTKGRGPFILLMTESYDIKGEALSREAAIKRLRKSEKMKLVAKC